MLTLYTSLKDFRARLHGGEWLKCVLTQLLSLRLMKNISHAISLQRLKERNELPDSLQTVRMTPHSDLHSSPVKKNYHSANINIGEVSEIRGCKTYNF